MANGWLDEIEEYEAANLFEGHRAERVPLTLEMRRKREDEIAGKRSDATDMQKAARGRRRAVPEGQELIQPIQEQPFQVLKDLASQRQYMVIFDKAKDSNMLYTNPKYDISDRVIMKLGTPWVKSWRRRRGRRGEGKEPAGPHERHRQGQRQTRPTQRASHQPGQFRIKGGADAPGRASLNPHYDDSHTKKSTGLSRPPFCSPISRLVKEARFGHIDTQSLLESMPERNSIQTEIEGAAAQYEQEIVRMQGELEAKVAEYQQKAESWPTAIRAQKEQDITQDQQGLEQFYATVQQELAILEQSLLEPMIERARTAIEQVGAEEGFTYIFDTPLGPRSTTAGGCPGPRQGQAWPLRPHRDFDSGIGGLTVAHALAQVRPAERLHYSGTLRTCPTATAP